MRRRSWKRKVKEKIVYNDPPVAVLTAKIAEVENEINLRKSEEDRYFVEKTKKEKYIADTIKQIDELELRINQIRWDSQNSKGFISVIFSKDSLKPEARNRIQILEQKQKQLCKAISTYDCEYFARQNVQSYMLDAIHVGDNPIGHLHQQLQFSKWALERQLPKEAKEKAKRDRKAKQNAKMADLRAAVMAADGKTRDLADRIKHRLERDEMCPYCGVMLGNSSHADHIYPVSKGGRSITSNMVIVCADCNVKKSNHTLRAFVLKFGLNQDAIEKRLMALGKDF